MSKPLERDKFHGRERRPARRGWWTRIGRPALIAVACLGFALLANPALGTAVGCLCFGLSDFRLSRRLKRIDPDRQRGRICSRFYLAWAFLKVGLLAFALFFVAAAVQGAIKDRAGTLGPKPAEPISPTALTVVLLSPPSLVLSALIVTVTVPSALRHRRRVWVGVWKNHVKLILLSAIIFDAAFLGICLLFIAFFIWEPIFHGSVLAMTLIIILFLLGLPVAILSLREYLYERIVARTPEECWPVPLDWTIDWTL